MGFKSGVILGPISHNATGSSNTNIGGTSNTGTINIGNTSSGAVNIDCGTAGINVGTTANAHTSVFGSNNSTSATTVQSGTGTLSIISNNGGMSIRSGTGVMNISVDSANTLVQIGTGAAVKTVVLGSTNTSSSLGLRYGTGDFSLASATGNVMVAQDTGEINYPLQPSFFAINSATDTNVTGNGTTYTIIPNSEIFDQNGDYNNATGTFTAPVTGRYLLCMNIAMSGLGALFTTLFINIVTSNRSLRASDCSGAIGNAGGVLTLNGTFLCDMDAADTAIVQVSVNGSTQTVNVLGDATVALTSFGGQLMA